ncbi:FHA domain-containing protein [Streptomyces avicenniae]|uniref:FHA domain-containing protein n=1 Tax=Streptomyces avicenniae TaxID=500153 RepID=UPI00069956B7|nr:FHA domain-containing protein [Streptomyces avicenniae]
MPTCPNGHQSGAEDWCEVCGHRIPAPAAGMPPLPPPPGGGYGGGPGGQPAPPPWPGATGGHAQPPPPPSYPGHGGQPTGPQHYGEPAQATSSMPHMAPHQGETCPQCGTPREGRSPFCEECRFNFLTNSATAYLPPVPPARQEPDFGQHGAPSPQFPPAPARPADDWTLPPPGPQHQQHQQHQPHAAPPPAHQPPPYPGMPGAPARPDDRSGSWLVAIGADPQYFTAMMRRSGPEAAQLSLPAYAPDQQMPLTGPQVTVGRRRQSTGESPDIDLSRPPEDPGVSHQHAVLVQQNDGGWAVIDQDSTNGTTINMAEDPIQPFVPVPLKEGDRVHIGAWTTLTLYRNPS